MKCVTHIPDGLSYPTTTFYKDAYGHVYMTCLVFSYFCIFQWRWHF